MSSESSFYPLILHLELLHEVLKLFGCWVVHGPWDSTVSHGLPFLIDVVGVGVIGVGIVAVIVVYDSIGLVVRVYHGGASKTLLDPTMGCKCFYLKSYCGGHPLLQALEQL